LTESLKIPLVTAPIKVGTRVGLFASYLEEEGQRVFRFYGWGTYEGDFLFGDEEPGVPYQTAQEKADLFDARGVITAPRLRLDDGTLTWGLLVWWDEESRINTYIEQADSVIQVDLKSAMAGFKANVTQCKEFVHLLKWVNTYNTEKSPGN